MEPQSLAGAFTVWAAVVGLVGVAIVWELSRLRSELRALASQVNDHILRTEHRLTLTESDIRGLKQRLDLVDRRRDISGGNAP